MNSESWNRLFSREELIAANERCEAQQFAERQVAEIQAEYQRAKVVAPAEKPAFVYRSRPAADWDARAARPAYRWERLHGHFVLSEQDRARLAVKARILVEIVQSEEFPGCTVAELAEASGMSQSWVRKHLRQSGITLQKPVRRHGGKS
jgi:hypothetical protein